MAKPPTDKIHIRGQPYYGMRRAAQVITGVSRSTLTRWASKGWTSFGYPLDTVRRGSRLLIPEEKVLILEEQFRITPLPRRDTPEDQRELFKISTDMLVRWTRPRSAISRANKPRIPGP
jgi:hypothetical protein